MIETSSKVTIVEEIPRKSITLAGRNVSLPDYINNHPDYVGFTGYSSDTTNQNIILHFKEGPEARMSLRNVDFVAKTIKPLDLSFDPKLAA